MKFTLKSLLNDSFEKFLRDVHCSFKILDGQEAIGWILGLAVRLGYGDNAEKYN